MNRYLLSVSCKGLSLVLICFLLYGGFLLKYLLIKYLRTCKSLREMIIIISFI